MTRLRSSKILGILLSATLLLAFVPGAEATHNNRGTLKVHDNVEETPETRNVPHVSCGFYLEGFFLGDDSGWIRFYAWPPTGDKTEVTPSGDDLIWEADEGEVSGEFHLLKGPYYLPAGHYRVEIFTHDGHPGSDAGHFAKSKTFWVEPCDEGLVNPPCPEITKAEARATDDGNEILLEWSFVAEADSYVVYRAVEGGEFEAVAMVDETTLLYVDASTEAGVTYEYYVTAVTGDIESEACEFAQVTAVPFFPSAIVGALALVGSVGLYAVLRRK